MARTKITVEVESESIPFVEAFGKSLVVLIREHLKQSRMMAITYSMVDAQRSTTATIVHDGKNVTEVIQ